MPDISSREIGLSHTEHEQRVTSDTRSVMERRIQNYSLLATERLGKDVASETGKFFTTERKTSHMTPLEYLASSYEVLTPPQDSGGRAVFDAAVRSHAAELAERAFDQQVENPRRFLSHGFDHTLNVSESGRHILEQNPFFISTMREKYGISEGLAKFMLENVIFFHDTGYRYLGDRGKAAHALAGADIVANERVRDMFRSIIRSQEPDIERETVELLLHDFRDAILFHNADTVQQAFNAKVVTSLGEFLTNNVAEVVSTFSRQPTPAGVPREVTTVYVQTEAAKEALEQQLSERSITSPITIMVLHASDRNELKGRVLDLQKKDDRLLGLEYKEIDAVDAPMQAFIRLADNMDITTNRFIGVQHEPAFQEAYMRYGNGKPESEILKQLESLSKRIQTEAAIASNAERMLSIANTTDKAKEIVRNNLLEQEQKEEALVDAVRSIRNPSDAEVVWKEVILKRIFADARYSTLSKDRQDEIAEYAVALDSNEIKHFGGCEPVESVVLDDTTASIRVNKSRYDELNSITVNEETYDDNGNKHKVTIGLGDYQIWRLTQAYKSIHISGEPISIRIVDEQNNEIKQLA